MAVQDAARRLTGLSEGRCSRATLVELDLLATSAVMHPPLLERRPWRGLVRRRAEPDGMIRAEIARAKRADVLAMLVAARS